MQIDVDMSYEQYFEANRLFCLKTTMMRRLNFLMGWYGYPILGLVFALIAMAMWIGNHRFSSEFWIEVGVSVFFVGSRFYFPIKLRRCYERQAKHFPKTITLTQEGMHIERKDAAIRADFSWSAFEKWLERPELFLAFPGQTTFVRIPKDKLNAEEQDQVRGWLSAASTQIA